MTTDAIATDHKDTIDESQIGIENQTCFISWALKTEGVEQFGLLDNKDFSNKKLVFFDPMQFAVSAGLWEPKRDLAESAYVSFDTNKFRQYLEGARTASAHFQTVLKSGGMLIIRGNIPKAFIKVRKRSSAGSTKYTESVISTFFWLEEILGSYSVQSCNATTLKYHMLKNPLNRIIGNVMVKGVQTVLSVGNGKLESIAGSGASLNTAAVSRVTFETHPGQIYFIPEFVIKDEHIGLMQAFEQIYRTKDSGAAKPVWLKYYQDQLRDYSPCKPVLAELDLKIKALRKQEAVLLCKQAENDGIADLLYETNPELEAATRIALEVIGFECTPNTSGAVLAAFEAKPIGEKSQRLMVRTVSTEKGGVKAEQADRLYDAIQVSLSAIESKGALVGNPDHSYQPEKRTSWFEDACIERAKEHHICLMPSLVLFTVAIYILTRTNDSNIEDIKFSLRRDIFECDGLFVLSRKKYAI